VSNTPALPGNKTSFTSPSQSVSGIRIISTPHMDSHDKRRRPTEVSHSRFRYVQHFDKAAASAVVARCTSLNPVSSISNFPTGSTQHFSNVYYYESQSRFRYPHHSDKTA